MKKLLLFGLMALTLSLGVSCKKDEVSKQEVKTEIKKSVAEEKVKLNTKTQDGPVPIDIVLDGQYNPNVYPHNTGLCHCKQGPKCWGNHYNWCPAKEFGSDKLCMCWMHP